MSELLVKKLKKLEGETFTTVSGKSFTYKFVSERAIRVSRTAYPISLSNFETALLLLPSKPSEISKIVRGSSYVFAIINDLRFALD